MELKHTIIKCVTAVLCVIAICITSSVGIGKICDARKSTGNSNNTNSSSNSEPVTDVNGEPVTDVNGEPVTDPTAVDPTAVDPTATTAAGETTKANGNNTTNPQQSGSKMPSSTADIINYYNTATAKVVSSKAGYSKTRVTDNEKMEAPALLQAFKSLVYKFMGIGAENKYSEDVAKGNWGDRAYIFASKLTAADVSAAKCTASGSNYLITLNLKDGSSTASKDKPETQPTAALDKCGICVGTTDKGYYDHKTASVIYSAIAGTYASAKVDESYSNAKVTATINSANGQMVSLKVEWNIAVSIVIAGTANATGTSHVNYTNFKF